MKKLAILFTLLLPVTSWAGAYKCTDASGNTHYQSSPCTENTQAHEINLKTFSKTDLNAEEQKAKQEAELKKQQSAKQENNKQAEELRIEARNKQAQAESELTQALIKQKSKEFSAYAIPTYEPNKLPDTVKPFIERLPEIERYRRIAAEKALATLQCQRVEDDQLTSKSAPSALVFLVSCSTGKTFFYNESELK